ncbi:hypothetical protein CP8484711_1845B, partial [Chlamydia psittaci 84-8471/1]
FSIAIKSESGRSITRAKWGLSRKYFLISFGR